MRIGGAQVAPGWTTAVGLAIVGGLALVGLLAVSAASARTAEERALADAKERLGDIRAEITAAEAAADDAEEALADADATLREVEAVVNDVATAVERQRIVVRDARSRLAGIEEERDALVAAFHQRAVRMFKLGPTRTFDVLFSGDVAADAVARTTYLRTLLEGDQVDLEAIEAAEVAVDAERERAEAEEARLAGLLTEQQEVLAEVEQLRASRALAAADARERVRLLQEEQDDLEGEQERLEELIRQREAERRRQEEARRAAARQAQAPSRPASTSGYAWPLCAPVTSEYGPRWGRMHRGIDLGAPTGTPIGAARAGQVLYAGWRGGYGRLLLLRHDDGVVTAYAHLSRFAVGEGQWVQRGQTIGAVGSTGNSTGPHLHLEFRVGGQAQNPRQFLSGSPC